MSLGFLGWYGWLTEQEHLSALHQGLIPMAPNTATCLILASLSIIAIKRQWSTPLIILSILLVAGLSGLRIIDFLTSYNTGVENLFWSQPQKYIELHPTGLMAFPTALGLSFLSLAVLATERKPRWAITGATLCGVVASIGTIFLLGYFYGAPLLYKSPTIPMAATTSAGLVLLSLALLSENATWLFQAKVLQATERQGLLEALSLASQDLESLVERSEDALLILDSESKVLYANRAGKLLLGSEQECSFLKGLPQEAGDLEVSERRTLAVEIQQILWRDKEARLFTLKDVTEARRANRLLQETENLYRHSQKMEALGRLAGGVAHDFNNLLTAMLGYSELLQMTSLSKEQKKHVEEIARAAYRASDLTSRLLSISRSNPIKIVSTDASMSLRSTQALLERLIPANIQLSYEIPQNPLWLKIDESSLEQIVLNLVVNARDAMSAGGKIAVKLTTHTVDESHPGAPMQVDGEQCLLLEVSDDGCGIDPEVLPRIFEPYFTTKEIGKGTGLGLSTVYGIVERVGGATKVHSSKGKGTSFQIYFAAADPPAKMTESLLPREPSSSKVKTKVLLVEDDPALQLVTSKILQKRGYSVTVVSSAEEALSVLSQEPENVNVVVSDLMLPKMSGWELAHRVLEEHPQLPFLLMSGYSRPGAQDEDLDLCFLEKPFNAQQLTEKIQEAMLWVGKGVQKVPTGP